LTSAASRCQPGGLTKGVPTMAKRRRRKKACKFGVNKRTGRCLKTKRKRKR